MSISSTRRVSSSSSASSRVDKRYPVADNYSQHVETIDTTNNVLVQDENDHSKHQQEQPKQQQEQETTYNTSSPNVLNSIEALAAASFSYEEQETLKTKKQKINVYTNNQSIIHDKDVEHTGRSYLKHFYEKNEHMVDIDELV